MDVHSPKNGINRYWSIPIWGYHHFRNSSIWVISATTAPKFARSFGDRHPSRRGCAARGASRACGAACGSSGAGGRAEHVHRFGASEVRHPCVGSTWICWKKCFSQFSQWEIHNLGNRWWEDVLFFGGYVHKSMNMGVSINGNPQ